MALYLVPASPRDTKDQIQTDNATCPSVKTQQIRSCDPRKINEVPVE